MFVRLLKRALGFPQFGDVVVSGYESAAFDGSAGNTENHSVLPLVFVAVGFRLTRCCNPLADQVFYLPGAVLATLGVVSQELVKRSPWSSHSVREVK
ncbi:hypothetical protein [Nisaea sp.]|uniref:hypothetical protein n=1 Tax=Nisaea sp. TaxID=2024842 RepID=UPI00329A0804